MESAVIVLKCILLVLIIQEWVSIVKMLIQYHDDIFADWPARILTKLIVSVFMRKLLSVDIVYFFTYTLLVL